MKVVLTFDDREWRKLLDTWEAPAVRHTLEVAAESYGMAAVPVIANATPVAPPGNRYAGSAGNLRRLTRYALIKPSLGVGVVVAAMGKGAYYRRFVTYGTKAHSLARRGSAAYRSGGGIHHPGSRPNDYVGRAAGRADQAGYKAADRVLGKGLDGEQVVPNG